jgi:hypothetical protein
MTFEDGPEQDFVYGFPLYFVAVSLRRFNESGDEALQTAFLDLGNGRRGTAVFTEELLAERDTWNKNNSQVFTIHTQEELRSFCRALAPTNVSHLVFDPLPNCAFISPITEFI